MTSRTTSAEPWGQWPLGMVTTVVGHHANSALNTLRPGTLVPPVARLVKVSSGCSEHDHVANPDRFTSVVSTG